jgi:peroxiredoxin
MHVALTLLFAVALTVTAQTTDDLETSTLPRLATAELEAGEVDAAENDAHRLLALAAANSKEWNHDDLLHAAYTVLGRVALERGDLKTARARLLESARIKGSAALESFGPDLKLARELLAAGERDVVLQYLDLCRGFWKYDRGRIDQFAELVKNGVGAGAKAPGFSLRDLHGNTWTLSEFSGREVILSFWASWCLQCREELAKLADDPMTLAINVGEDEATVRRFVEKNPIRVPVLLAGDDTMVLSYKVVGYPTQVVIDANGQIAAYRTGIVTKEVGQSEQGAK